MGSCANGSELSPAIVDVRDHSCCGGFAVSKERSKRRTVDAAEEEVNFEVEGTIVKITIGVSGEILDCQDNSNSVWGATPIEYLFR